MFAKLSLHSKQGALQCDVEIELFERRCPNTVRNFLFALNGHLLSDDERAAQQQPGSSSLPPAPLLGSKVLRVDPGLSLEFGTSATRSIFGGFFGDEGLLAAAAETDGERGAVPGALMMCNVGPNTNASQFMLLMGAIPELSGKHTCFGMVRKGLSELSALCQRIKINSNTLVPHQPLTIAKTALDHRAPEGADARERRKIKKMSGVVRRRDDDEEEDAAAPHGSGMAEAYRGAASGQNDEEARRFGKRRRGEVVQILEDGTEEVVTTAIPCAEGKAFDLFESQELAFHNDLLEISEKQATRKMNRDNRRGKMLKSQGKKKGGRQGARY